MTKAPTSIKLSHREESTIRIIKSQIYSNQLKQPPASGLIKNHMSKGRLSLQSSLLLQLMSKDHDSLEGGKIIYQIIKDYTFFKILFANQSDIPEEKLFRLCSRMQLEYFPKGSIIFREGEKSNNKMYVIATGKVAIVMSKSLTFQDQIQDKQNQCQDYFEGRKHQDKMKILQDSNPLKQHKQNLTLNNISSDNSNHSRQPIVIDNINLIIDKYGFKLNELTQGQQFGEKVLFAETTRQQVRSATSIAMENVYLIVLMRDDFIDILKQFKNEQFSKKQLLFKIIPKFDQISSIQVIENILYSFKEQNYGKDANITQEGITQNKIYIVFQGEVAIIKKNIILATIGLFQPSILGEEALFNADGLHEYTSVVVSTSAKVLKMSAKNFQSKSPQDCIQTIKQTYFQKQKLRDQLFKEISKQQQKNQEKINQGGLNQTEVIQSDEQFTIKFRKELYKNKQRNQIISLLRFQSKENDPQNETYIKTLIDEGTKTSEDIKSILINKKLIDGSKVSLKSNKNQSIKKKITDAYSSDSQQKNQDLGIFSDEFKKQINHKLLHYGVLSSPKSPQVLNHMSIDYLKSFTKKILRKKQISQKKFLSEASLITNSFHQSQDLSSKYNKLDKIQEINTMNEFYQDNNDINKKIYFKRPQQSSRNHNKSINKLITSPVFLENKSEPQIYTSSPCCKNQISYSLTFKQLFKQYRNENIFQKSQLLEQPIKQEMLNSSPLRASSQFQKNK